MNIFDLLGYRSDRPYSINSKTNVGQFALVGGGSPPPSIIKKLYVGSTQATNAVYVDGSGVQDTTISIYIGSTKVWG